MKKAIILDLDGTLFNSARQVSDMNRAVLQRCSKLGILIVIATARPLRTVLRRLPGEMYYDYLVLCNGAWVWKNDAVLYRNELSAPVVGRVVRKLYDMGYVPAIEANDCFYTNGRKDPAFEGSYFPLNTYQGIPACKVLAQAEGGFDHCLIDQALCKEDVSWVVTDNRTLLQVCAPGCSKLNACTAVLQTEGVDLTDTYAFGDDNNDILLLEAVGCGIAMANATPELCKVAKYIVESNDDDGVAKGIMRYVLIDEGVASVS